MRIWLDDIRLMPSNFDIHCKTANEAIRLIKNGNVDFISFDHDLADHSPNELTGYTVAVFIEKMVFYKKIKCPDYSIHSANPVGRKNIESAMNNAKIYSEKEQNLSCADCSCLVEFQPCEACRNSKGY